MGSKAIPQALITLPGTPSKKLGFSTSFPAQLSTFNTNRITLSRVSSKGLSSTVKPLMSTRKSFVVRAEASDEVPEVESESNDIEVSAVAVAVAEKPPTTPFKPRVKLGDIMGLLNKRALEASEKERPIPDLRSGDIVEIKLEVPENRRRQSIYKGIVISKQNAGIHTTIRIRRIIAGVGVEIVFPVYSPNIKEIKLVKHRKVRRARLYYLRDKLPRLSTFK
ncbi:hypothetical protein MKW98_024770 [Papaver atlanticum]|uniref:50S ribosomal protein L19, chloroplastic n=1 Tax=Papaver atlanticum TaxID=357466 RepID=A0AAD4T6H5_9MAGN|nr:hypothetical protein MKW98_024770 [Papaver atlanticum]